MTVEKGCARGEKWKEEVERRRQRERETKENKKKDRRMRKESGGCR